MDGGKTTHININVVQTHIAITGASMYPEERQQAIAAQVIAQGRASVTELA